MARQIHGLALALTLAGVFPAGAQTAGGEFPRALWRDEVHFLARPAHLKKKDFEWLAPVAGATAFLIATDRRNMGERIHSDAAIESHSATLSNAWLGSLVTVPAFLAWQGWRNGSSYDRETGWLAARAVAETAIATEALRLVTRRRQPAPSGAADFFRGGFGDSAFPSLHTASAWAVATVIANRYPGWITKAAVYGLAAGVSATRVLGREHSPSDVFVGGVLGSLIGKYVAGKGSARPFWDRLAPPPAKESKSAPAPSRGAEYIPMNSWIYGALDRLAAMGLIPSQTSGLRPWTRAECERQIREAESFLDGHGTAENGQEAALVDAVRQELGRTKGLVALDSVYTINGVAAGPVLNDSFHFGQTWTNNYGRPFGRGWNGDSGFTAHAEYGPVFAYVNGEYQHAPAAPAYSLPVRETIANLDYNPVQPALAPAATNRFRTLDAYAGVQVGDFQFSIGKQSLWWGPTLDSPLSFGSNAEPARSFRASMVHPVGLPAIAGHRVQFRAEFVMGKLGGQQYTWRPWFNAQKVSFKLTDNLEMGFTRWSIFWGVGHPITAGSLLGNFTSTTSPNGPAGVGRHDPGDRKGGFDFRYRIPGLRDWLTLYSDSYADDDPSPLAAPRRAAIAPGIYLTHFPGLAKLDFRLEAPSTTPLGGDRGGTFIYYNDSYHSGNTNYGYLLGNPVGRDARVLEGWTSYWLTPRSRLQAGFRQLKGGGDFLPGGATQSDATLGWSGPLGNDWRADLTMQYERFWIPVLGGPQRNLSLRLQITGQTNLPLIKRTP